MSSKKPEEIFSLWLFVCRQPFANIHIVVYRITRTNGIQAIASAFLKHRKRMAGYKIRFLLLEESRHTKAKEPASINTGTAEHGYPVFGAVSAVISL